MGPVIECVEVSKTYRASWWFHNKIIGLHCLNWRVLPAERWLVIGPNRAGKSTLLRLLVSLSRPTAGNIYRFGQPTKLLSTLLKVGYLSENADLPGYWRVGAFVHWVALLHGVSYQQAYPYVESIMEHFGLSQFADWRISQLSRGLRQKVGLASAFVHDPDLVILDDPLNALDQCGRDQLLSLLSKPGDTKTYIVSSVHAEPLRFWATHILELNDGQMVYCGPASQHATRASVISTSEEVACASHS